VKQLRPKEDLTDLLRLRLLLAQPTDQPDIDLIKKFLQEDA
jgi:hypothetical protein